jgi:hypothetical protein
VTEYKHVRTSLTEEASVAADEWMQAAADWAEHIEFIKARLPLKVSRCVYAEGMRKGKYPLTRLAHIDKSAMSKEEAAAVPDIFSETLIWIDSGARMLLYQIPGEPWGMRNYFAFNEVEELGPNRCRVTVSSRLDLPKEVSVDNLLPAFHAAYKVMIVGTADYAKNKKKVA